MRAHIADGDTYQVNLTSRLVGPVSGDLPALYGDLARAQHGADNAYLDLGRFVVVGASPELLVRRDGQRAQTVALAGTTRRSADPAVDDHLGEQLLNSSKDREEQAIVSRRIERTLAPVSLWVAAADDPVIVKVHNVQHLATPIRAQLSDPLPVVELAGRLLPTPAVGGEPREAALPSKPRARITPRVDPGASAWRAQGLPSPGHPRVVARWRPGADPIHETRRSE